jgi:hypothetical protein
VSSAPLWVRAREAASVCKRGAAQGRPSDVSVGGVLCAPLSTERLPPTPDARVSRARKRSPSAPPPLLARLSLPRAFQPVIRILDIVTHCRAAPESLLDPSTTAAV